MNVMPFLPPRWLNLKPQIKRIAREQLGYGREGEVVIRPYLAPTSQSGTGEPGTTDDATPRSKRSVENWRLWWWAFFPPTLLPQE